jgi:hypothetical protein
LVAFDETREEMQHSSEVLLLRFREKISQSMPSGCLIF